MSTVEQRTQPQVFRYAPLWQWVMGLAVSALVAYFTSIAAIQSQVAANKATQESNFQEVLRRLDLMQSDIRELRTASREH